MKGNDNISLARLTADMQKPTLLFQSDGHAIYWLGITEDTVFRCNVYLIKDGDEAILVDPGSRSYFRQVKSRVAQIMDPAAVNGMILCHQDPDVAASMVDWLDLCPNCKVYTSPRAQVLLPHFGISGYRWQDIEKEPAHRMASGRQLHFITAPFLHSPAAFASLDAASGFLFSGDIWAALMRSWQLTVSDFEQHRTQMDIFHMDYMASNVAARGFIAKLDALNIHAILPQHGSIISHIHVAEAFEYLRTLQCGTDIAYPELR